MAGATAQQARPRGIRLWLRAFVGFYPPHDESARTLDPVAKFLFSARSVGVVAEGTLKQPAAAAGPCTFLGCATERPYLAVPIDWVLRVMRW